MTESPALAVEAQRPVITGDLSLDALSRIAFSFCELEAEVAGELRRRAWSGSLAGPHLGNALLLAMLLDVRDDDPELVASTMTDVDGDVDAHLAWALMLSSRRSENTREHRRVMRRLLKRDRLAWIAEAWRGLTSDTPVSAASLAAWQAYAREEAGYPLAALAAARWAIVALLALHRGDIDSAVAAERRAFFARPAGRLHHEVRTRLGLAVMTGKRRDSANAETLYARAPTALDEKSVEVLVGDLKSALASMEGSSSTRAGLMHLLIFNEGGILPVTRLVGSVPEGDFSAAADVLTGLAAAHPGYRASAGLGQIRCGRLELARQLLAPKGHYVPGPASSLLLWHSSHLESSRRALDAGFEETRRQGGSTEALPPWVHTLDRVLPR